MSSESISVVPRSGGGSGSGVVGVAAVLACMLLVASVGCGPSIVTSSSPPPPAEQQHRGYFSSSFGVAGASASSINVGAADRPSSAAVPVRVLVMGDHLVCGVAPRSGAVSGVPEGTPSFRMALSRSLAATPPTIDEDDGDAPPQRRRKEANAAAAVRAVFVGPQHLRHGGSSSSDDDDDDDAPPTQTQPELWTGPYAGGWSLTAEEAVRMRLVDDWIAAARPRAVVLVLGGNDLGRAAMAVTAEAGGGGGVYTDDDDDEDRRAEAEDAAIDRAIVRRVSLAVVEAAKRAAAALSQAAMSTPDTSRRGGGGGVDTCADCTVVVAGLAPLDASRHPHADLVDATNAAISARLASMPSKGQGEGPALVWAPIAAALVPTRDFLRPPAGLLPTDDGEARVADAILSHLRPALSRSGARATAQTAAPAAAPTIGGRAIKLPSAASLAAGFGITVATVIGLYAAVLVCGARGAAAVLHGQPLRYPTPPPPVRAVHANNGNGNGTNNGAAQSPKRRRVGSLEEAKAISAARKAERHAFKHQLAAAATGASARRSSPAVSGGGATPRTPQVAASLLPPPLPSAAASGTKGKPSSSKQ